LSTVKKLSVSVPREVWSDARRFVASGSDETSSALITRVLRQAVERAKEEQYARGYAEHPYTPEEEAAFEGFSQIAGQAAAELRFQEEAAHLPPMGGHEAYERWKAWRASR
jgi:hypothetical protein